MKIKFQVQKIRCVRNSTFELNADEIYFTVFAIGGKKEGDKIVPSGEKYLHGFVSEVQYEVKRGMVWKPADSEVIIDLADAEAFILKFGLYEMDNGNLHREMREKFENGPITPPEFPWPVELDFLDTPNPNWVTIVIQLSKLLGKAISSLQSDDLMGNVDMHYHTRDTDLNGDFPQEYAIRKVFGKYEVALSVSKVD